MNRQVVVDFLLRIFGCRRDWERCHLGLAGLVEERLTQPIAMRVIQTLLKQVLRWAELCNRIADHRVLEDKNLLTISIPYVIELNHPLDDLCKCSSTLLST